MTLAEITDFVLENVNALETEVQHILDASLPNKQQHKAASQLVRDRFKATFGQMEFQLDQRGINELMQRDKEPVNGLLEIIKNPPKY